MEWFLLKKWNHRTGAINCFCLHSADRGGHVDFAPHLLAEYNFDMAKARKKAGRPRKKPPVGAPRPKLSRTRYGLITKNKAIELHEGGMSLKDIHNWFIDNLCLNKCVQG